MPKDENKDSSLGQSSEQKGNKKSKTPVLDNFGRDLTAMAEQGKLDPVVGREKEIHACSQILSRRKKNNPLLLVNLVLVNLPLLKAWPFEL